MGRLLLANARAGRDAVDARVGPHRFQEGRERGRGAGHRPGRLATTQLGDLANVLEHVRARAISRDVENAKAHTVGASA